MILKLISNEINLNLWKILSFKGNLKFVDDDKDQASVVNGEQLNVIARLLGSEPQLVEKALCYRVVAAKSEVVDKGHHASDASYGRDALAKVCGLAIIKAQFLCLCN